jgi:hypothetical protein
MIKRLKPAILVLTFMFYVQGICGQNSENMTDYLSQRFISFCKSVPREEIFIHSDREEYISGENLWFKVYLIDRQSFNPSSGSKIVYFELLNAENRPVVQKRIFIDKGFGPGQIVLPDTLTSGTYTMRVYTNWMKNFLPNNCFMKDIQIYNTLNTKRFKGKQVRSSVITKGSTDNTVPDLENPGVSMRIDNDKPEVIEISVNADKIIRTENNNRFYLFIQTHGNINHVSAEILDAETTKISLPKKILDAGVNQITIFNSKGEPVAEKFIYTPAADKNFLILTSADSCGLRSRITLNVDLGNQVSTGMKTANLSISVAPRSKYTETMDMTDYLLFGTEFEVSGHELLSIKNIDKLPSGEIDSILKDVRSNWINWAEILSGEIPEFKYRFEKEDHFLPGRLITSEQQGVGASETLLMCTPGKEAEFQYTRTDQEGNFNFSVPIDEGLKDLIIMPDDITKNHKIIMDSPFADKYQYSEIVVDSSENKITPFISKYSVNQQVQKIFEIPSVGPQMMRALEPVKSAKFYDKPDLELNMADYISLPVMSEIFFELLPGVSMKKKKTGYEILIANRIDDHRYVLSPCLMIDGVIINDAAMIANLDPEIVEKIDVVKEKYLVGNYFFNGIVNVITKSGDFSCVSLPDYMIRLHYRVLDPVSSFVSPDYSRDQLMDSRVPDYRNTLYWNPSVIPDKKGQANVDFWSSDNKSDYVINIQGITQDGKIVSIRKDLKVK